MDKNKMDIIHLNWHHITDIRDLKINGENCTSISETDNIIYVSKNGSDETGNGSFGNPFLTIEYANNYAIANISAWPIRTIIKVAPGLYAGEHITQSHYRVHIIGNSYNLDSRERDVIIANTGVDAATYPLGVSKYLNLNNITVATMDDIYDDYVSGTFGTLMGMTQFSNCTFKGGYFVEQEASDAENLFMNFDQCFFSGDAFKLATVERNFSRFIALRNCDVYSGTMTFESTGTGNKTLKIERSMIDNISQINGDWNILMQWSEIYNDGKLTFDTDGYVDVFSSILVNGIHFYSDTPETKKCVNCIFKNTPIGEGDITSDAAIEFIEYSGNHQHNGIDGEVITVSKIKNVGGGQNNYRNIHEALKGSVSTDTIINLEGDVEVSEPLIINPGIEVQIDGNKKWKLTSIHATTLCELGENQQLSFVNMKQILGGKKVILNGNNTALSFVSCGRYTEPNYVNIEINDGDIASFIYIMESSIIGTAAPVVIVSDLNTWFIIDRSFLKGASTEPAIEWMVDSDSRFRAKYSTFIHGSGSTNSPLLNSDPGNGDITFAIYNCGMNASFPSADFTNSINNANITVDPQIDY